MKDKDGREFMRLPTLEQDFWTLRSGEAMQQAYPGSFIMPPLEVRQNLSRGQLVKLIFDIELEDEAGDVGIYTERMWVVVGDRFDDCYVGILDNEPTTYEAGQGFYLCVGAEIPFRAEHVVDIDAPPTEYVTQLLGKLPEHHWPRGE